MKKLRQLDQLSKLIEQEFASYETPMSDETDQQQNNVQSEQDVVASHELVKYIALLKGLQKVLAQRPLVGCRKKLYIIADRAITLYEESVDRDIVKDKVEKLSKLYKMLFLKLVEEAKKCLQSELQSHDEVQQ